MKIQHLSSKIFPQSAAYRLHRALLKQGVDSNIISGGGRVNECFTRNYTKLSFKIKENLIWRFESFILNKMKAGGERNLPFHLGLFGQLKLNNIDADLLQNHMTVGGFLGLNQMKSLTKPLVWTLHDSWGYTGGCHIPYDCTGFKSSCKNCPQVEGFASKYIVSKLYDYKRNLAKSNLIKFVSPSRWIAQNMLESGFCEVNDISVIPNGIDVTVFNTIDKSIVREMFGIPEDKIIIGFGAVNSTHDFNKGYDFIKHILSNCDIDDCYFVIFGGQVGLPAKMNQSNVLEVGHVYDDAALALLYNAFDFFIAPSRSENFPTTAVESMACNVPILAFAQGGFLEQIEHKKQGYLVQPFDLNDLALGFQYLKDSFLELSSKSKIRDRVLDLYADDFTAGEYVKLYRSVCEEFKN